MSAMQRSILALALMLMVVMVSTTPAAAQYIKRGLWVDLSEHTWQAAWTLTVINLTNSPLTYDAHVTASGAQRPPFNGNTLNTAPAFPIPPYRTVTWKSNTSSALYPTPHWTGYINFVPQGWSSDWGVVLHFNEWWPIGTGGNKAGTWVALTGGGSSNWAAALPDSCSLADWYHEIYNVMTLSGTNLAVSLYAPFFDDGLAPVVNITLVFQQRWPQTSLATPCLTYLDISSACKLDNSNNPAPCF